MNTNKNEKLLIELPTEIMDILRNKAKEHNITLEQYVIEVMVRGALRTIFAFEG